MKRLVVAVVLAAFSVIVLVGCGGGGGGGGIGSPANATPPSALNAGVSKNVTFRDPGNTSVFREYLNFTGEITVSGNTISLTTAAGKNIVFVGWTMIVEQN